MTSVLVEWKQPHIHYFILPLSQLMQTYQNPPAIDASITVRVENLPRSIMTYT